MFEMPFVGGGDIPEKIWSQAKRLPTYFKEELEQEVKRLNLPRSVVPALQPCNVWAVLDSSHLYIAFSHINAGGMPRKTWEDARNRGSFTADQIAEAAIRNVGIINPQVASFSRELVEATEVQQKAAATNLAKKYAQKIVKALTRPPMIPSYESLQGLLDLFYKDHPNFEKNVFIGMRFRGTPQFKEIHQAIKKSLARYRLIGLRADDKVYPQDDDLWDNVCVYMMGCKYGAFVFEDIEEREFNPNVPLEYGFMRAMGRRILLLKEKRMPRMPTDIIGKLYKPFDIFDIDKSIAVQVTQWAEKDLGLTITSDA